MSKEIKIEKCPYCGSENYEHMGENDYWNGMPWHCHECDSWFNEEEYERQELRHQISPLLNGTSEEEPAEIFFNLPSADEEACALSSLEIPAISKIFEMEGEGTMWYHIFGEKEENGEDTWHDLDELGIGDLSALLDYLRNER